VHDLAQKVCGPNNGFKFIQAPCSIMMPEIFSEKWQIFKQISIFDKIFNKRRGNGKVGTFKSSPSFRNQRDYFFSIDVRCHDSSSTTRGCVQVL
jgi:hypothetical protein